MTINPLDISIRAIKLRKSSLDFTKLSANKIQAQMVINQTVKEKFQLSNNSALLRLHIQIQALDKTDGTILPLKAEYVYDFDIEVQDLRQYLVTTESGSKEISSLLKQTLAGLVYSTARGLVFMRLLNTPFAGVILPVIPPASMLE